MANITYSFTDPFNEESLETLVKGPALNIWKGEKKISVATFHGNSSILNSKHLEMTLRLWETDEAISFFLNNWENKAHKFLKAV